MSNKTVVDAVNYAEGDIEGLFGMGVEFVSFFNGKYFKCNSGSIAKESGDDICTINEFNQCVAEMSEGLLVPDCRPKQPEIQYDKDGNGWEVGSVYEFSDGDEDGNKDEWIAASFKKYVIDLDGRFMDSDGYPWKYIRQCQSPIGKIHRKPVELVDGAAYQFSARNKIFNGIYEKDVNKFNVFSGQYFNEISCSNIIRLVPEVK